MKTILVADAMIAKLRFPIFDANTATNAKMKYAACIL